MSYLAHPNMISHIEADILANVYSLAKIVTVIDLLCLEPSINNEQSLKVGGLGHFFLMVFLLHCFNRWMQLQKRRKTKKKKDHQNRTKIDRMVSIFVSDLGVEFQTWLYRGSWHNN